MTRRAPWYHHERVSPTRGSTTIVLAIAAIVSIVPLALIAASIPHFWIGSVWSVCAFVIGASVPRAGRVACRAISIVAAAWGIGELYAGTYIALPPLATAAPTDSLNEYDPALEFRLRPGAHLAVPATEGHPPASYTIDADGLRVGPQDSNGRADHCVLFFGCSFTFGEGLNDDQTLANQVAKQTVGRFDVRNFGVGSTSPTYALGQIQTGLVDRVAKCTPSDAFYLVIPHHLIRIVGAWVGRSGPRYQLSGDGTPVRSGVLGERNLWEYARVMAIFSSALYPLVFDLHSMLGTGYVATADDVHLYRAVMTTMKSELQARWPQLRFHILVWDAPFPGRLFESVGDVRSTLSVPGISTHFLSRVLPGISTDSDTVRLAGDDHPNAWANGQIATFIVEAMLNAP